MSSQLDLDQGGTFRQFQRVYLGPSVGWVDMPQQAVLPITNPGVYNLARGTNLVTLNINGNVTINLPSSLASAAGAQAVPRQFFLLPITIVDIGGYASINNYIINPFGTELISNLPSISLKSNFGAFLLKPILETGGWTLLQ